MIKAKQTKKQASLDSIPNLEDEVRELNRRKKVQCLAAKFQDVINYRNKLKQEGLGYKPLMLVNG